MPDTPAGEEVVEKMEEYLQSRCLEEQAIQGYCQAHTLDGDTPMPYTGWIVYDKPEPGDAPIGGMDHEEEIEGGHFLLVVTYSGKGPGGRGGDREPGVAGDSGKFFGGIMGSPAGEEKGLGGTPDDDIPYHTMMGLPSTDGGEVLGNTTDKSASAAVQTGAIGGVVGAEDDWENPTA